MSETCFGAEMIAKARDAMKDAPSPRGFTDDDGKEYFFLTLSPTMERAHQRFARRYPHLIRKVRLNDGSYGAMPVHEAQDAWSAYLWRYRNRWYRRFYWWLRRQWARFTAAEQREGLSI